jgi:hypothetical protein
MNPKSSQQALAQLQNAQKSYQSPNDILSQQRQQLGVQGAEDTVTGLRGAINNTTNLLKQVAPSVMGRTGSSLVTNAQAVGQINNEQRPIAQNLTEQGQQYGEANTLLDQLTGKANQAATGIYQANQDKSSYLQNLYSTLYGKEQDAVARRQADLDRKEQIRQFNAQLAESRRASNAARAASDRQNDRDNKKKTTASTDPLQQKAYDDVKTRVGNSENDSDLISDYKATEQSAARGNKRDRLKLDFYNQLRPDLFKNKGRQLDIILGSLMSSINSGKR